MFSEKSNAMTLNKTLTLKLILIMKVVNVKQHTFKYMSVRGMRVMKFDWRTEKKCRHCGWNGTDGKMNIQTKWNMDKKSGHKNGKSFCNVIIYNHHVPLFFICDAGS